MRGKHVSIYDYHRFGWGSPPHAREAPQCYSHQQRASGITPACAGSTSEGHVVVYTTRDHPRMRGKHYIRYWKANELLGSPPHAREAPFSMACSRKDLGITPACAGSTNLALRNCIGDQDHPRMRGKH